MVRAMSTSEVNYGVPVLTMKFDGREGVNLDGVDLSELDVFIASVGADTDRAGRDLFPSQPTAAATEAAGALRYIALHQANAIRARKKGEIARAQKLERNVTDLIASLPSWARW